MFTVSWRGVRLHPVRFLLSILAVILGIAFFSGTFSLRAMLSDTFDTIVESGTNADAYVQTLVPAGDQGDSALFSSRPASLPISLADELEQIDGVKTASAAVSGVMVLVGADGTAVAESQAPTLGIPLQDGDEEYLTQGRLPADSSEIALEDTTAERAELTVGDSTVIVLGGQSLHVEVVGIMHSTDASAGANLVWLDSATGLAAFAPTGQVSSIAVFATDPGTGKDGERAAEDKLVAAITASGDVPADAEVITGQQARDEATSSIHQILGFVSTFLLIFAGIALFVGAFIIANTFAMVVRQRMRELAVLRAIGASPTQVFASVLTQAAVVGLIGSALGVLAGYGLVEAISWVMGQMGMDLASSVPFSTQGVIASLVVGVVVALVSAALPARKAASTPPVDAMRESVSTTEKSLTVRAVVGAVVLAGGIAAAIVSATTDGNAGAWLGVGAIGILLGVLMVAPVLAPGVTRVLAWPFVVLVRPLGRLARGNVARNPRRTATTASALTIGMALVGTVAVIASSADASVSDQVDDQFLSDFVVQQQMMGIPSQAVADIESMGLNLDELAVAPVEIDQKTAYIGGVTDQIFVDGVKLEPEQGDVTSLHQGMFLADKRAAERFGWQVGDTVTVTFAAGNGAAASASGAPDSAMVSPITADGAASAPSPPATGDPASADPTGTTQPSTMTGTIGAIYSSPAITGLSLMMPMADYDALVPTVLRSVNTIFVNVPPGMDTEQVRTELTDAVKPYYVVSVLDKDQFATQLSGQINAMLAVLYALLGLSIVIGVLGIVNTLALSIMERTREIGLMRAVGLGRLQLAGTIMIESVLIAVFGAATGLAIGVGLAAGLPNVLADTGLNTLAIPWGQLAAMLGVAGVVGVLAALWPAVRATRLPVLEAVSYE